jgi:hypothetical protein
MTHVLHLTNHIGTTKNINALFYQLNTKHIVETLAWDFGLYINKCKANEIWEYYKNNILKYDILFFTDTSMNARPFLQNINKHKCIIIVYITNRYDWGMWHVRDAEFYQLYSELSTHERVFFCSDNTYDQYYAEYNNITFRFNRPIKLTPILKESLSIEQPFDTKHKLFVYNRGTTYVMYQSILAELNIEHDVFGEHFARYRDFEHICEYKAVLHFPYQTNTQSLWEYSAYNIIYFIPSKKFIYELIDNTSWYYWEEKNRPRELFIKSIELSEWYISENETLFIYFDSWKELKDKVENITDFELIEKHAQIKEFMKLNNKVNIDKWKYMLNNINIINNT